MYSPESLIHFGIISCRSKWQPTPVFLPGKSHIRRKLVSYSLWGRKELDTTERLHSLTCHSKASLYTHTDDRSQSTWNHWGLCYVANAHWGMVLPLLFFFGDGGRVLAVTDSYHRNSNWQNHSSPSVSSTQWQNWSGRAHRDFMEWTLGFCMPLILVPFP